MSTKKEYSQLRFLLPLIVIFFGSFYWLEGFTYFIKEIEIWPDVSYFLFFGFWVFTFIYLFKRFIRINFLSKLFILLIALSVSFNFYVMLRYNHLFRNVFHYSLMHMDMLIIRLASYMSILGVFPIVVAIITPKFQAELNYLTNITRIRDREIKTKYRLLEIWSSFPVFMGIHSIFFLTFVVNDTYRWGDMPFNYVVILILPWLFLMLFHIIYSSVVGLKK